MRDLVEVIPCLESHRGAPAVVDEAGESVTWDALAARVDRRARALTQGETVLLHEGDAFERVVDVLACERAGALAVVVLPRVPRAVAIEHARRVERAVAERARTHDDVTGLSIAVMTSGSTRAPRAVLIDGDALLTSARSASAHIAFERGHRWLLSLSLAHVGGLGVLARARLGGGALALPPQGTGLADALRATRATHVSLVAAQLQDLVEKGPRNHRFEDTKNIKAALIGGGPVGESLLARATQLPLAQTWGMSETCAQVATSALGAPSTCGAPLPGRSVRVGADGELLVKGGAFARLVVEEETAKPLAFDEDGFFHTRDRGEVQSDGHVVVLGRLDTVFISGGENVQPELIERALASHPTVARSLVVPVPHARYGQRPFAFVDVAGEKLNERSLRAHLAERLARHEIPDAFALWPSTLREGKPSRPQFAERARALIEERAR